jgi:cell wall-associated NlpC family hydrolase
MLYQSSDPAGFVDRAAMVDSLSRNDVSILGAVHAAQEDATTTARAASQAAGAAKAVVAQLATDKSQVQASAAAEGKVLDTLVAQQKEQIRQAAIALAKAIREKRAADAARYRAAQAAAVKAEKALETQRAAHLRAAQAFAQAQDSNAGGSDSSGTTGSTGSTGTGTATRSGSSSGSSSGDSGSTGTVGSGSGGSSSGSGSSSSSGSGSGSGSGSSGGSASGSVGGSGSSSTSSAAATAVHWAYQELGKSYVWAASGPNHFDCSGLTMYVYQQAGIYLPHSSAAQYNSGRHVSRSEMRPGDLVFFGSPIHHVGIYVGNGDMIESPQAGESVKVSYALRGDMVGAVRVSG